MLNTVFVRFKLMGIELSELCQEVENLKWESTGYGNSLVMYG